ncbi:MAG: 3-dehydroquinate synthase, partial [Bacteroidales bacterium]
MNHIEIISALLSKINPSKIVIIADANLMQLCPGYFNFIPSHFSPYMLAIPSGEKSKSLTEATYIWQNMLENNFDKDSLLINFGGGMICDLGGFVAANYKRGIRFLNIPTTLLAMIDAAIGGKNGLNLHHIKNAIGSIHLPEEVIIDTQFLMTLSPLQLLNGWGELIKYA